MQSFVTAVIGIIMIGGTIFGAFGLGLSTEKMFRGDYLREATPKQKGEIIFWGVMTSTCAILAIVLLLVR